jgi:hypothetical protein
MAEKPRLTLKQKPREPARTADGDRFPSNEELLHELRLHGAKPPGPREIPVMSRRTRDYLLLAGLGSATILLLAFRVLGSSDLEVTLKLAMTGISLWCGLAWFIFYGVMSRY